MVELRENNRFAGGVIETFADNTQELIAQSYTTAINAIKDYQLKDVVIGNEISCITYEMYKNAVEDASKFWWLIAEANDIDKAWELDNLAGESLRVPDVIQFKLNR